jgi:hypothetical protein
LSLLNDPYDTRSSKTVISINKYKKAEFIQILFNITLRIEQIVSIWMEC